MSCLRHGAPPGAWLSPGPAALGSRAARPRRVPSDTRHARYNNSTVRATRGKAVGDLREVDKAAEHRYTSLPLRERHSLSWQVAMRPKRCATTRLAQYARRFLAASGAMPALDEGDGWLP